MNMAKTDTLKDQQWNKSEVKVSITLIQVHWL